MNENWNLLKTHLEKLEDFDTLDLMLKIEKGEEIEIPETRTKENPYQIGDRVQLRKTISYSQYEKEVMGKRNDLIGEEGIVVDILGNECMISFPSGITYKEKNDRLEFVHDFEEGQRVMIQLRVPYTASELSHGCDSRVDGKTAIITHIDGSLIRMELEKEIGWGKDKFKVYSEFAWNLKAL